jgi:hypothetical protein
MYLNEKPRVTIHWEKDIRTPDYPELYTPVTDEDRVLTEFVTNGDRFFNEHRFQKYVKTVMEALDWDYEITINSVYETV